MFRVRTLIFRQYIPENKHSGIKLQTCRADQGVDCTPSFVCDVPELTTLDKGFVDFPPSIGKFQDFTLIRP
jgi:hypothetical protein